jgi:hypothetical protein
MTFKQFAKDFWVLLVLLGVLLAAFVYRMMI